jgi:hypothetical protein
MGDGSSTLKLLFARPAKNDVHTKNSDVKAEMKIDGHDGHANPG